MCFLREWNVTGNWSQCPADFFEGTWLAGVLAIEPAIPGNWFRLEDAHLLRNRDEVNILGCDACIHHHLLDRLPRHATCHFHPAETFLRYSGEDMAILE